MRSSPAAGRLETSAYAPLPVRAHPLVFGVVLFLASELMFFAGLFAAYYDLRGQNAVWPPAGVKLDEPSAAVGTALLGLSSWSMYSVTRLLSAGKKARAKALLGGTMLMGAVFLAIAMHGWVHSTFGIASHAYGSIFYAMTGFHALHVTAGLALLAALLLALEVPAFEQLHRATTEAISYYWHFVFVVWLGIWASIYLVK